MPDELYDETDVMPGPPQIRAGAITDATRPEPRDLASVIARVEAAMRGTFEATRASTVWNSDLAVLIEAGRENERLTANINRLTDHPGDYRYWENRYRDEAAEVERLREALTEYLRVKDAGPTPDIWDKDEHDPDPPEGTPFDHISDWAWEDYHDAVKAAEARVRAALQPKAPDHD